MLPETLKLALARRKGLIHLLAGDVEVNHVTVRVPDLPASLDGLRIGHISDLHIGLGRWVPISAAEAAALLWSESPDIVVNTGDFLQGEPSIDKVDGIKRQFVEPDRGQPHPLAHLAILGNHDYYAGLETTQALTARLESMGVQVLVNKATCVQARGSGLSVVGFSDDAPGFGRAVGELLASGRPRLALVHEPDLAERLPRGSADLVLAGHTHGAQIALPGLEPLIVRKTCGSKYVHGMYTINDMPVYVNRGLGTTGVPIRFRARPEVAVIQLVR